jgi:Ca2+-transporting ATPase
MSTNANKSIDSLQFASNTFEECCSRLNCDPEVGLSGPEVLARQRKYGQNKVELQNTETALEMISEQVQNPMILLLLGSAILSALVGEYGDAISITVTIIIVLTGLLCVI